jgi:hypothetical protein
MAALLVHRPSPESKTHPANPASAGSFASASAVIVQMAKVATCKDLQKLIQSHS